MARMAGECMCGAWDEPSTEVLDLQQQLAARTAELIAMTAARDEMHQICIGKRDPKTLGRDRVAELRAVGKEDK